MAETALKITFELSTSDLRHFQKLMTEAKAVSQQLSEAEICARAEQLLGEVRAAKAPAFILERMQSLRSMIDMARDGAFAMAGNDKSRVLTALAYFADPADLIPDHVPGLGFMDDAIMVELVTRELKHELDAYRDFCAFREREEARMGKGKVKVDRAAYVEEKRRALFERVRDRRRRDARRGARLRF
jgi:uncharacterized membrane protein YkvA (DUF1232 family)